MMKSDFRIVSDADDDLSPAIRPLLDETPDLVPHPLWVVIPVTEIDVPQYVMIGLDLSLEFILIHRVDSWNRLRRQIFG